MRKKIVRVLAVIVVTLAGTAFTSTAGAPAGMSASPATAAAPSLTNAHYALGQYCLDASTSNGVRLRPCDGTTFQQWYTPVPGQLRLNRYDVPMCLDGSTSNGIRLRNCDDTTFQRWLATSEGELVLDRYDRTMCLDGSVSNGIRLQNCNGTTFQKWLWYTP
ncbi:ricin-type beta-trefoil lectin domain protein [Actinosynnema sp. NPDC059335]|uniref:RICIN domain-containing protein n=1 Tax=Actinosynnema sp. NPDC059335 TaxID=3346804 RepID=UPI003670A21D